MKSSRIMRNTAPAALVIAQDTYKEDHVCIIIEKYGASVKIEPKWKLCEIDYFIGEFMKVYKLWYWCQ